MGSWWSKKKKEWFYLKDDQIWLQNRIQMMISSILLKFLKDSNTEMPIHIPAKSPKTQQEVRLATSNMTCIPTGSCTDWRRR